VYYSLLPCLPEQEEKKRKRGPAEDGWDSEDSDFEDLKGFERSGLSLALRGAKSVALAPSIAASLGGRSLGAKSAGAASRGGRSAGGRSQQSHGERSQKHQKGSQHSGDRFKAKKKGTGAWDGGFSCGGVVHRGWGVVALGVRRNDGLLGPGQQCPCKQHANVTCFFGKQ